MQNVLHFTAVFPQIWQFALLCEALKSQFRLAKLRKVLAESLQDLLGSRPIISFGVIQERARSFVDKRISVSKQKDWRTPEKRSKEASNGR